MAALASEVQTKIKEANDKLNSYLSQNPTHKVKNCSYHNYPGVCAGLSVKILQAIRSMDKATVAMLVDSVLNLHNDLYEPTNGILALQEKHSRSGLATTPRKTNSLNVITPTAGDTLLVLTSVYEGPAHVVAVWVGSDWYVGYDPNIGQYKYFSAKPPDIGELPPDRDASSTPSVQCYFSTFIKEVRSYNSCHGDQKWGYTRLNVDCVFYEKILPAHPALNVSGNVFLAYPISSPSSSTEPPVTTTAFTTAPPNAVANVGSGAFLTNYFNLQQGEGSAASTGPLQVSYNARMPNLLVNSSIATSLNVSGNVFLAPLPTTGFVERKLSL